MDRIAGPTSQTFHARGMTVLPDDTIIVADTGGARLVFFGPEGAITGRIGSLGSAPGQLREPTDVAVDAGGTYYVLEAYNHRLWRGYDYILVGDEIVVIDPRTHEIVAILDA